MILLDLSRKVFVNETCFDDQVTSKYILKKLDSMGFSKDNIVKRSDLYLATAGDYEIRRVGGYMLISQVEIKDNDYSLKQIGEL